MSITLQDIIIYGDPSATGEHAADHLDRHTLNDPLDKSPAGVAGNTARPYPTFDSDQPFGGSASLSALNAEDSDAEAASRAWARGETSFEALQGHLDALRQEAGSPSPTEDLAVQPVIQSPEWVADARAAGRLNGLQKDRHVIYEAMAHKLSYQNSSAPREGEPGFEAGVGLSNHDLETLQSWGFEAPGRANQANDAASGCQGTVFIPNMSVGTEPSQPVLALAGTNPMELADAEADLDIGIGKSQFESCKPLLEELMEQAGAPVVVTGHSLAGAHSQRMVCEYPQRVSEAVTFQSPGIGTHLSDCVQSGSGTEDPSPTVSHYQVASDIVSSAGEAKLPGPTTQFTADGMETPFDASLEDLGAAHMSFLLYDPTNDPTSSKSMLSDHYETSVSTHPSDPTDPTQRHFVESGRQAAAAAAKNNPALRAAFLAAKLANSEALAEEKYRNGESNADQLAQEKRRIAATTLEQAARSAPEAAFQGGKAVSHASEGAWGWMKKSWKDLWD